MLRHMAMMTGLTAILLGSWTALAQTMPNNDTQDNTTATTTSAVDERGIEEIIQAEGYLSWSDGTSVYTLHEDHSFTLDPVGMSGRTIRGQWALTSSSSVIIYGQWSWMNGVSPTDDYRKMQLNVSGPAVRGRDAKGLYQPFFSVEELVKVSQADYDAGLKNIAVK